MLERPQRPTGTADGTPATRPRVLPIRAEALRVARAGRLLLDIGDFRLDGTGVTVVMGPNGAGKSLFLRVLAGLLPPDSGTVTWDGARPDRRRAPRLGFVFQKPVLLRRSVLGNLRYALGAAGFTRREARKRAAGALEEAGLSHLAAAPARVLSGGEQQRVAMARALAAEPDCLFLDEPTASLDPASQAAIEALVAAAERRGTRVLLTTHDIAQARRLAGEAVFMHRGRIIERGAADAFFRLPRSPEAQAYLDGKILI